MRKLPLLSIILLCSLALLAQSLGGNSGAGGKSGFGGGSIFTRVSHCVAVGTGTCTINSTGATLIIVDQLTGATGTLGAAPTENKSNTFQVPAASKCANGTNGVIQGYYIYNPTVGTGHIFTGGAASNVYFVSAWAGTDPTSAVYDTANCNAGSSGHLLQPGSVTPAGTNELIYTMAFDNDSSGGTWTAPANFTIIDNSTGYSAESTAYYVYPSTVAINPTWYCLRTTDNLMGNIMAFKHQ